MNVCGYCAIPIISTYIFYFKLFSEALKYSAKKFITNFELDSRLDGFRVRRYMHLWIDLSELCEQSGQVFAWTYLYLYSVVYLVSLPALYIGTIMLKSGQHSQLLSPISTIVCLSVIAEIGNSASTNVWFKNLGIKIYLDIFFFVGGRWRSVGIEARALIWKSGKVSERN